MEEWTIWAACGMNSLRLLLVVVVLLGEVKSEDSPQEDRRSWSPLIADGEKALSPGRPLLVGGGRVKDTILNVSSSSVCCCNVDLYIEGGEGEELPLLLLLPSSPSSSLSSVMDSLR